MVKAATGADPTSLSANVDVSMVHGPPDPRAGPGEAERLREEIAGIVEKFYAGQHEAVIERVEEFAARYPLTGDNVTVRFYQAESCYRLGQVDVFD